MRNILVVGHGYVGKAMTAALDQNPEFAYKIVDPGYPEHDIDLLEAWAETDAAIICVPTPQGEDHRCDDSIVIDVIEQLTNVEGGHKKPILIKSTTDIDTLRMYEMTENDISFSPEFLRGRHAVEDFLKEDKMIIGCNNIDTGMKWAELFEDCLGRDLDTYFLSNSEAGYVKYAENSFLAMRVTFFNELFHAVLNIETNINSPKLRTEEDFNNEYAKGSQKYESIVEALGMDPRIGHSHNKVPGPDGSYGWGGHCLPKDTLAWTEYTKAHGGFAHLMEFIRYLNFARHTTDANSEGFNPIASFYADRDLVDASVVRDNIRNNQTFSEGE